jgi:hypothetical protein
MSEYERTLRDRFSVLIRVQFVRVEVYVDGNFVGYRWTERLT